MRKVGALFKNAYVYILITYYYLEKKNWWVNLAEHTWVNFTEQYSFEEYDTDDLHKCRKKTRCKLSERIDELLERLCEIAKENMKILCELLREEK